MPILRPPLALTMGDPAGIGPEIIAKLFAQQPALAQGCFVAGDVQCMRRGAAAVAGSQPPLAVAGIESAAEAAGVPPRCIPVLQVAPGAAVLPAVERLPLTLVLEPGRSLVAAAGPTSTTRSMRPRRLLNAAYAEPAIGPLRLLDQDLLPDWLSGALQSQS